jgi:hypothetical protein
MIGIEMNYLVLGTIAYLALSTGLSYYALTHSKLLSFNWSLFLQLVLVMPFFTPMVLILTLIDKVSEKLNPGQTDHSADLGLGFSIYFGIAMITIEILNAKG